MLKDRKVDGHKGDFGKVGIIGGSQGMCGSVILSAKASLRTGSGLVYNFCKKDIFDIMQIKSLENIIVPIEKLKDKVLDLDAIAIGMGMGRGYENLWIIEYLVENFNKPIIIDADAIYLSKNIKQKIYERDNIILTPHVKEFEYFTDITVEDRKKACSEFFSKTDSNNILVLKGKETIICSKNEISINTTGNDGMATAGSGDVLSGVILSLLGQGYDVYSSAKLGVYIHGLSGDIAAKSIGKDSLIASDIVDNLSYAIKSIRKDLY